MHRSKPMPFASCDSIKDDVKAEFLVCRFPRVCLTDRMCAHSVQNDQPDILPGMRYSLDEQCAFKFGKGYNHVVSNKLLFCRIYLSTILAVKCMF